MTTCKVCGGAARPFGEVDFNRTCEDRKAPVFPPSGQMIPYERCTACGLIFTTAFDSWSVDEFRRRIYNDDYARADPDYVASRPATNAAAVTRWWSPVKKAARVLDYGGGNGRFAALLGKQGFRVETYDPVMPGFSEKPSRTYQLVTCFETLEHMPDPVQGAAEIASFVAPGGLILFSTLVQPPDIERLGSAWWYIGPRNGHITLHSRRSLEELWRAHGLTVVSFDAVLHAAFRRPPPYLSKLLAMAK